jgi:O-antigen ligase
MHLYDQVLTAASQAPATGYGYGTFEPGFRLFKDLRLSGLTWNLAHNSYLEFYFGTGLYGLVIIICAFVCIFFGLVKGAFLRAHDTAYLITGVSALTIVGLHALTDFSIQMPAMGAALVFVAGLGYARIIVDTKGRSRP